MYKILIAAICCLAWIKPPKPFFADINVMTYGATGNGHTDDTNAINAALAAANTNGVGCYFPTGNYLCNTITSGTILSFHISANGQSIYGTGTDTITTNDTATTLLTIYCYSHYKNFSITGIFFQGIHPVTQNGTSCLYITGTPSQLLDSSYYQYNRFEGFYHSWVGLGLNHVWITYNTWRQPLGHDGGQNNTAPNVYVSLPANSNGYIDDIYINHNNANGYTGTNVGSTTGKNGSDGFINGVAWGFHISQNITTNFSQEHYFLQPWPTSGLAGALPSFPNVNDITNNQLDCSLPAGSMDGTVKHKYDYGIRVDASSTTVQNNIIHNSIWGIMSRPIDWTGYTIDSIAMVNNRIFEATDTSNYSVQKSLFTSSSGSSLTHLTVTDNQVETNQGPSTLSINGTTSPILLRNNYVPIGCNCFF